MICDRTKEENKICPLWLSIGLLAIAGCALPRLDSPPTPAPRRVATLNIVRTPRPSVTLAWTNPPLELWANGIYTGGYPRVYTNSFYFHPAEQISLTNLAPGIYYFAVTAFDTNGLESPFSNEVIWTNRAAPLVTNFLLSVQIQQSGDFTNWTTFTNLGQFQATNTGAPVYWRALMNIQPQ